jgi:hypothetical protein
MYAKAMKKPYTPGPGYTPSAASTNSETTPITEDAEDVPDYGGAKE